MRSPLVRMRLRTLYAAPDKLNPGHQEFHTDHSKFGMVRDGGKRAHQGWDLSAPAGTSVYAIAYGKIKHVQTTDQPNDYDRSANYGRHVVLEFLCPKSNAIFAGKTLYAFYAHLGRVDVFEGVMAEEGTPVGTTGRSGKGAGHLPIDEAHLHFEIRTIPATGKGLGNHLDPALFFKTPEAENCCKDSPRADSLQDLLAPRLPNMSRS